MPIEFADSLTQGSIRETAPTLAERSLADDSLEAILCEQRRQWLAGDRKSARVWLQKHRELADFPDRAAEVIYHEFALRRETGDTPSWDDYLCQFPEYAEVLQLFRQADGIVGQALVESPPDYLCRLQDYELLEEIGRGGMGVVYRARHRRLERIVALKTIRAAGQADAEERRRFQAEARVVARLDHPGIVRIYEVGEANGEPFLALEFVNGQNLAQRLAGGPLPARSAASMIVVLASAVHYAHQAGVIHRDLKPSNVLVAATANQTLDTCALKITDFGVAKCLDATRATGSGALIGTPSYMSPEQAGRATLPVDRRADVYGLGTLFYEMLTGRPPFRAESALKTLQQVVEVDPARPRLLNPAVPRDLETICLKCLEKDARRRYSSAAELADDLGRWLRGEPVRARRVGPSGQVWRWCRRKPVVAGLLALLCVSLTAGLSGIVYQWRNAEAARKEAVANEVQARELLEALIDHRDSSTDMLLRTVAHWESLLQKRPQDRGIRRTLTAALAHLGDLYCHRMKVDEAEICFRKINDLWAPLADRNPLDSEIKRYVACARYWQAIGANFQGRIADALGAYLRADCLLLELAEERPEALDLLQDLAKNQAELVGLVQTGPGRDAVRAPLEQERQRLYQQAADGDFSTRMHLGMICSLLGRICDSDGPPQQAITYFMEAYDSYRQAADFSRNTLFIDLSLAKCCSRLMTGQPGDRFHAEAVERLQRSGNRMRTMLEKQPGHSWLRAALIENHYALALCYWKAGESERAEECMNAEGQFLANLLNEPPPDPSNGRAVLDSLCSVANSLWGAGQTKAALTVTRTAGDLAIRYAAIPSHDLDFHASISVRLDNISSLMRRLGNPTEALRLGEKNRELCEALLRQAPENLAFADRSSACWTMIGKALWDLGRQGEALDAFQHSMEIQKRVLEQSPGVYLYRETLSRCYDRIAYWGTRAGNRARAEQALLEREKLWTGDCARLLKISEDFKHLADSMGRDKKPLTPEELAEQRRYLQESYRTRGAAEGTKHPLQ